MERYSVWNFVLKGFEIPWIFIDLNTWQANPVWLMNTESFSWKEMDALSALWSDCASYTSGHHSSEVRVQTRRGGISGEKKLLCTMGLLGLHAHRVLRALVFQFLRNCWWKFARRKNKQFCHFAIFCLSNGCYTIHGCMRAPLMWLLDTYMSLKFCRFRCYGSRVILWKPTCVLGGPAQKGRSLWGRNFTRCYRLTRATFPSGFKCFSVKKCDKNFVTMRPHKTSEFSIFLSVNS